MKLAKLDDMTKGWFVGAFQPSVYNTEQCEVAVKSYKSGDYEEEHYHMLATEITLILSGKARMFDQELSGGDIIIIEPKESTSFTALTDITTVVVKIPGAMNDKFLGKYY